MNTSGFYDNSKLKNYYLILQIDRNAEPEVISFAYKALAKKNHPDVGGTADKMKLINEAYDVLKDPDSKNEYDKLYDAEAAARQKAEKAKDNAYESKKASSYQQSADYSKENSYQQTGTNYSNYNYYQQAEMNYSKDNHYKQAETNYYNNYYYQERTNNYSNAEVKKENNFYQDSEEFFTDDVIKKSLEKNLSDNTYEVFVNRDFVIPWACVCCLEEAERRIKVKYKFNKNETLSNKYKLIYSHFPICKKCKRHITEFIIKKSLFIALPLLTGIITMLILFLKTMNISWTTLVIISSVTAATSAFLLNLLLKMSPLEDNHANRAKAVNMLSYNESGIRFWFDSWCYAELFAKNNHTHAVPVAGKKDGRESFFLKGKLALQTGLIILIIWISIIIVLTFCLKPVEDIWSMFEAKVLSGWWKNLF